MSAYYQLLNKTYMSDDIVTIYYNSTIHTQGVWNPHEQHMATTSGIIATELEQFLQHDDMRIR